MELIDTNIKYKSSQEHTNFLNGSLIDSSLNKNGLRAIESVHLNQSKVSMTNDIFDLKCVDAEGIKQHVILKCSSTKTEPREIHIDDSKLKIGGWLSNRLNNEYVLLQKIQALGVSAPKPLFFIEEGTNSVLAISHNKGVVGSELRYPKVSEDEFRRLEYQRGYLLGKINSIDCANDRYGPVDPNSTSFSTWTEYFNIKVSTTLSLLHGMYPVLNNLRRFSEFIKSETAWQKMCVDLSVLYGNSTVQKMIENDSIPTLSHGDYWDGNTLVDLDNKSGQEVSVIDFDRGGIEGQSFDLALWLSSKTEGKKDVNPVFGIPDFLRGYEDSGKKISRDIKNYVTLYGLWQYLDFLVIDCIHQVDRSNKSMPEIDRLFRELQKIV